MKFVITLLLTMVSPILFATENIKFQRIVFDKDDSRDVLKAAEEFNNYFAKVSGQHLKKESNDPERISDALVLGKAAKDSGVFSPKEIAATGRYGGYRIREKNGNIFIAGDSPTAALYGVYKLLGKMGCRFYARNLELIPKKFNLKLRGMDILEKPFYDIRLTVNNYEKNGQQKIKGRVPLINFDKGHRVYWPHTALGLVRPELYKDSHPEYYTQDYSGKSQAVQIRNMNDFYHDMQLCVSNREVREIARKKLLAWMDALPESPFYNIGQNDGFNWCMCEKCKKLDTIPGKVTSDRNMNFVNYLAEAAARKNPDKIITTFAYTSYTAPPPEKNAPLKNVRVFLCPYIPEVGDKGHWFDHKYNREFMRWYQAWLKKYPGQVYIFEYPFTSWEMFTFLHEQMFFRMKQYAKDGIKGIFFCGRPIFMMNLFNYVASKLAWDPKQPVAPLVEDFIRNYYGAAAPHIQEIYDTAKEICARPDTIQGLARPHKDILTVGEAKKLLDLYDKAETAVKGNKELLERIYADKIFVLRTFLENYNPVAGTAKDMKLFKSRLGEYIRLTLNTKRLIVPRDFIRKDQEAIKNWFWSIAGLKLTASDWRKDPVVIQLMNDPQKVTISVVSPAAKVKQLENGWQIPLERTSGTQGVVNYKWKCKPAKAVIIRNGSTSYCSMKADFDLPLVPQLAMLELTGLDDDKPGKSRILVKLNDQKLYQDKSIFDERKWTLHSFKIPAGVLKKGRNTLEVRVLDEGYDFFSKWLAIRSIKIISSQKLDKKAASLMFSASYSKSLDAEFARGDKTPLYVKKFVIKGKSLDAGCDTTAAGGEMGYSACGNYNPEAGMIELEVKPTWDANNDDTVPYRTFIDLRGPSNRYGFLLYKYRKQKKLTLRVFSKNRTLLCADISKWQPGQWHKIAFNWDKESGVVNLWVDGKLGASAKGLDIGKEMSKWLAVGSLKTVKNSSAAAFIRNLNIYNSPLVPDP